FFRASGGPCDVRAVPRGAPTPGAAFFSLRAKMCMIEFVRPRWRAVAGAALALLAAWPAFADDASQGQSDMAYARILSGLSTRGRLDDDRALLDRARSISARLPRAAAPAP